MMKDCKTVLDLGCGDGSPIRFLQADTYGIDANRRAIRSAKEKKTHDNLKVMNIKKVGRYFKPKAFDGVVALDLIEHLEKKGGFRLISDMERLAAKKVMIFTPNGFISQSGDSDFDKHRSGWESSEFKKLGYKVYGMYGPKKLRGGYHKIKFRPELFFALMSDIIQWTYTVNHPETAAALLAVKELKVQI